MNCNCCNRNNQERAWVGTGLKFAVTITAEGFDQGEDDWKVVFQCGRNTIELTKADMVVEGEDFIATVDTALLGAGTLSATTYAYVPDDDWDGGIRTEIDKQDILYLKAK